MILNMMPSINGYFKCNNVIIEIFDIGKTLSLFILYCIIFLCIFENLDVEFVLSKVSRFLGTKHLTDQFLTLFFYSRIILSSSYHKYCIISIHY